MSWYYVSNNEKQEPVEQAQFERLVQQGVITGETLVWREGMANWQPYQEIAAPPVAAAPSVLANPGSVIASGVVCSECGQSFAADQVIRLGSGFVCARCKPIVTQKLREGVSIDSGVEQIRKDHIKHEASVKSIGMLYFFGAGLLLLSSIGSLVSLSATQGRGGQSAGLEIVVAFVFIGFATIAILLGSGVRRLKPWARIGSGILSGIGLLGFPLGTIINGYILYLLFSKKGSMVFSDEYKRVIQQTPHIKYRTSVIILVALGVLLLLMVMAMAAFFIAAR